MELWGILFFRGISDLRPMGCSGFPEILSSVLLCCQALKFPIVSKVPLKKDQNPRS